MFQRLALVLMFVSLFILKSNSQQGTSPNQWTWINGYENENETGVYGNLGVPHPSNRPGGREAGVSWTDDSGNLWLFGGYGKEGSSWGELNDLWKYNPATNLWVWVNGDIEKRQASIYGSKGIAAASNKPGARSRSTSWKDSNGNFWLFGGYGTASNGQGNLNDLWKYNPSSNMWTWVSGGTATNQVGVYGIQGISHISNIPGARTGSSSWVDANGNFWIFGGEVYTPGGWLLLNDLWQYNTSTNQWIWMKGTSNVAKGVYGTRAIANDNNSPGGRYLSTCWTDKSGSFWLFGGFGSSTNGQGLLNDLWKYDRLLNQWIWIKGDTIRQQFGDYGTLGVEGVTNKPGGRYSATGFTDNVGNLWFFGGEGFANHNNWGGRLSDLWKYNPVSNNWSWIKGDNVLDQGGTYGGMGTASAANKPGSRVLPATWGNGSNVFWLFGGLGRAAIGVGELGDLWKFELPIPDRSQTINFPMITDKCAEAADFALDATASSGLMVSYTSSNPSVAKIAGNTLEVISTGIATITAMQPGNSNYDAAVTVSRTVKILGKAPQTIVFTPIPAKEFGDADFSVTATASSGLDVTYASSNTAVATVDALTGLVHIKSGGSVVITASQAGNSCNLPKSLGKTINIAAMPVIISFNALADRKFGEPAFDPGATSTSPFPVQYKTSNINIAVFSNGKIVMKQPGKVNIIAFQQARPSYAAPAEVVQELVVLKGDQVIKFPALTNKLAGTNYSLSASAPGGTVSFKSSYDVVAEVRPGSILKMKKAGVVTITARQAGNKFWNAATATQSLTVLAAGTPMREYNNQSILTQLHVVGNETIKIYPNPVTQTANVQFNSKQAGRARITITNLWGKTVMQLDQEVVEGMNTMRLRTASLQAGTYYLQMIVNEELYKVQFLKLE